MAPSATPGPAGRAGDQRNAAALIDRWATGASSPASPSSAWAQRPASGAAPRMKSGTFRWEASPR